jgi:hypothetical protein
MRLETAFELIRHPLVNARSYETTWWRRQPARRPTGSEYIPPAKPLTGYTRKPMMIRAVLVLACCAATTGAQSVARPPAPSDGREAVQRLSWIAGCWRRQVPGGASVVEEHWMTPRAGFALGTSRTVRNDTIVVEFEQLRLFQRAGRAVYHAEPSGQSPTDFEAQTTTDSLVVFENPAHDFPQKIIYRKRGTDSLIARVEGTMRGQARAVDFAYARVPCR